jgi:phage gpG-like protein
MANEKGLLNIRIQFDDKKAAEIDRFFLVSKKLLNNLKPMYEKFVPIVQGEIKKQFAQEGTPEKWERLKPAYLASFKKRTAKYPTQILKLTGTLWRAATKRGQRGNITSITNDGLIWGIDLTQIPYARMHNEGGTVGGRARGARMPKREFLRLTKMGIKRVTQKAHKFIRSKMVSGDTGFKVDKEA